MNSDNVSGAVFTGVAAVVVFAIAVCAYSIGYVAGSSQGKQVAELHYLRGEVEQ